MQMSLLFYLNETYFRVKHGYKESSLILHTLLGLDKQYSFFFFQIYPTCLLFMSACLLGLSKIDEVELILIFA